VGPTRQSHGPTRGTQAAALRAAMASLPPFALTIFAATSPSSTASCGFKRSAPPKEPLLSSSLVHASPLLSSPFTSTTAAPDVDTLECPSNAAEQEHRPQATLLPRASHYEQSPKPPHVVRRFHRGCLVNGRHLWPPSALDFTTTRSPPAPWPSTAHKPMLDSTPGELLSSRPSPNRFTKPSWSSSRRSPAGLVPGKPELAWRRRPASSARLLCVGWASH
jgi:hypothetical protein